MKGGRLKFPVGISGRRTELPSTDKLVRHDTTDRVLQAVCTGATTLEAIRERCSIGKSAAQRSAAILVEECLLLKQGERQNTTFKPTEAGRRASGWLRAGGTRKAPRR